MKKNQHAKDHEAGIEHSSDQEDSCLLALDTLTLSKKHMVNGIDSNRIAKSSQGSGCGAEDEACCTIF